VTKKDFQLIADTIRYNLGPPCRERAAEAFADALRSTNPRFDRERFLRACGVGAP
jgi:hypothetical protein